MEKAKVILKTGVKDHCAAYDPFGLCPCTDCFKCENADYRMIDSKGTIIRDFKYLGLKNKNIRVNKYIIEFFDEVDFDNIEDYLDNNDSDYRMTRIYCTGNGYESVVMRPSITERQEELERQKRQQEEFDSTYEEFLKIILGEEGYNLLKSVENQKEQLPKEKEGKIKKLFKHFRRGN